MFCEIFRFSAFNVCAGYFGSYNLGNMGRYIKHILEKYFIMCIILVICLKPIYINAQTFFIGEPSFPKSMMSIRFLHPNFKHSDYTNLSGIYDFSIQIPISFNFDFTFKIPFSIISYTSNYNRNQLGNIQAIIKKTAHKKSTTRSISFGMSLPTAASRFEPYFVLDANPYDLQSFLPNTISFLLNYFNSFRIMPALNLSFKLGPYGLLRTDDSGGELFVNYGLSFDYGQRTINFRLEYLGSIHFQSSRDSSIHSLVFGLSYVNSTIIPSLFYLFPLSTEKYEYNTLNSVLGLKISFVLP